MKPNQNDKVSIEALQGFESITIPVLLNRPQMWNTLDVDYHPPRVERLFLNHGEGYRIYLHVIHHTNEPCLFHKHNWPAVIKQIYGSYEMGITYSEKEIGSDEAHAIPTLARFVVSAGSYYEMTQTDALHYVRPITPYSLSIMLTNSKYPEHVIRPEVVSRPLSQFAEERKLEILDLFKKHTA